MKLVLALRFIERDGRRILQQRVGEVRVVLETDAYLALADDPVWEDVSLVLDV